MNKVKEVTVTLKKYFADGVHTCATDFPSNEVCQFLYTKNFGMHDLCILSGNDLRRGEPGYLVPCDGCILKEIRNEPM